MVRTTPVEEESPGRGMVWVGEFGKDFLDGVALVLAETIREKRGQVLGKTCNEKQGRGRPKAEYCG